MMKIVSDLHTHTTHSHGTGSVEDNVKAAIDKGLTQIAISDHGFSHPFYGIKNTDKYLSEIAEIKEKYKDKIEVLSNVELNLVSLTGELDLPKGFEDKFDLLTFGYHKMAGYKGLKNIAYFMSPVSKSEKSRQKNTDAYIKALNNYKIEVISHPGYGLPIDIVRLAEAAKETGAALEINSKHPEFTIDKLKEVKETGVNFVIGSDAHSPDRVGDFEKAVRKAREAEIPISQIINAVN